MLMVYEMVKYKFKIRGMFSNVDYTDVIDWVFESKLNENWFDFTSGVSIFNVKHFSPTDLLYSYYFALKTDAFNTLGVDADDFVRTITQELVKNVMGGGKKINVLGLSEAQRMWMQPSKSFVSEWNTMNAFCRDEKRADEIRRTDPRAAAVMPRSYILDVPADETRAAFVPYTAFGRLLFNGDQQGRDSIKYDPLFSGLNLISNSLG